MRKKILSILALLCLTAASAWADTETVDGYTWTYTVSGDDASIGTVSPTTGAITIPSSLGGKTVTSISEDAFLSFSGLTSVIIPASVTSIGKMAFYQCSGLTTVTIPASVTIIDENAFQGCSGLTTVIIGNGVRYIEDYAFSDCTSLTSVTIPASVESIGTSAFYDCHSLTSVTIGNGVKYIDKNAFFKCTLVENVYCFADPSALTWLEDGDDFKSPKATKCHVLDISKWGNFSGVNVFFENLVTTSLTANDDGDGAYWTSYYNATENKIVEPGATVYKAKRNVNRVTLTEIPDHIITANQAVLLKHSGASILIADALAASSADYSDNELKGGTTVTAGNDAYTLSRGESQTGKLGFYKFDGTLVNPQRTLDGSKAHLELPTGWTGARGFIGFDDEGTTAIRPTLNPSLNGGEWYDLSGRRLSGQPTKKGVYVRNGQKFIVK